MRWSATSLTSVCDDTLLASQAKMQGLEAQVLQLQSALQASELERARQAAELEVLMMHLPAGSLRSGSDAVAGLKGHKVWRHESCLKLRVRCRGLDPGYIPPP